MIEMLPAEDEQQVLAPGLLDALEVRIAETREIDPGHFGAQRIAELAYVHHVHPLLGCLRARASTPP